MNNFIVECTCDWNGAVDCDRFSGECRCKNNNIVGKKCNECAAGRTEFPTCKCNV